MEKPLQTQAKTVAQLEEEARANLVESLVTLIDISGSMDEQFAAGGRKHKAAQNALNILYDMTDFSICEMAVFSFDSITEALYCDSDIKPVLPEPRGGTSFTRALQAALEKDPTRIILASDGEASYPEYEVQACQEKGIPVDTIFIEGAPSPYSDPKRGEVLLKRISEETGGQFTTVDNAEALMEAFAQLETSNRLLLEGPADSVIKL